MTHAHNVMLTEQELADKLARASEICGWEFNDKALLRRALTHPSAAEEDVVSSSYERLEFLGDSVLGAIVATHIFNRFTEFDEGGMTRIKTSLVSGDMLSTVGKEIGLEECIIFGGSEQGTGHRGMHSALENVYEALVAALYLDGGIEEADRFVLNTLSAHLDPNAAYEPENPKSTLQEVLQADHITPTYTISAVEGPPHDRSFTGEARADGKVIGVGKGRSKKLAEVAAALDALEHLDERR